MTFALWTERSWIGLGQPVHLVRANENCVGLVLAASCSVAVIEDGRRRFVAVPSFVGLDSGIAVVGAGSGSGLDVCFAGRPVGDGCLRRLGDCLDLGHGCGNFHASNCYLGEFPQCTTSLIQERAH